MAEQLTIELDEGTLSYLRQRCVHCEDLAGAAADALRELALKDAVDALARWHEDNPEYAELADLEYDEALAELS